MNVFDNNENFYLVPRFPCKNIVFPIFMQIKFSIFDGGCKTIPEVHVLSFNRKFSSWAVDIYLELLSVSQISSTQKSGLFHPWSISC